MPVPHAAWIPPMLATTAPLPHDPREGWSYEVKWDGFRAHVAVSEDGQVRVRSRNGADLTAAFPELQRQPPRMLLGHAAVLDGELIALDPGTGRPDFARVAARLHTRPQDAAVFVAFDLLALDGGPLLDRPYTHRRTALEALGLDGAAWQTTPATTDGTALWDAVGAHGLEGVVAKRRASRYQPGRRSRDWRKAKWWRTDALPIVGTVKRRGRIAVLIARPTGDGGLRPAGAVEWGLAASWQTGLAAALSALATNDCPLRPPVHVPGAAWVQPRLALRVRHLGWTPSGTLRQPIAVRAEVRR